MESTSRIQCSSFFLMFRAWGKTTTHRERHAHTYKNLSGNTHRLVISATFGFWCLQYCKTEMYLLFTILVSFICVINTPTENMSKCQDSTLTLKNLVGIQQLVIHVNDFVNAVAKFHPYNVWNVCGREVYKWDIFRRGYASFSILMRTSTLKKCKVNLTIYRKI